MRYMIIVKANKDTEAGVMPSSELIEAMGRFNEALIGAGALVAAEGLQASSRGARVKLESGKFRVTDGPFAKARELIAGFWLIDVKSKAEAIEWTKRIPFEEGEEVEIRKVFEASDWEQEGVAPAPIEQERQLRESVAHR